MRTPYILGAAFCMLVLLTSVTAAANEPDSSQPSPWAVSLSVGYTQFLGVHDIHSNSASTIAAPGYALEIGRRFGSGHQIALRGDLMGTADGPQTYHEVSARQLGGTYGYVVPLGDFQFKGTAGVVIGEKTVAQSDVSTKTTAHPGLTGTLGALWTPLSFVGLGLDLVGSSIGSTVGGMFTLEFSVPNAD